MHLIHSLPNLIEQYAYWAMVRYGYWTVFFGVMLENAGVPVPGETILLLAGFFAAQGHLQLSTVMLVALVGAVTGDNAGFALGRRFGRDLLWKFGKYLFLSPARLEQMNRYFTRYGNKTILIARFVTGLRVFAAFLAGASHMPWRIFLIYNMLGALLWSVIITALGYLFGESWPLLVSWVGRGGVLLLVLTLATGVILWRVRSRSPVPSSSGVPHE